MSTSNVVKATVFGLIVLWALAASIMWIKCAVHLSYTEQKANSLKPTIERLAKLIPKTITSRDLLGVAMESGLSGRVLPASENYSSPKEAAYYVNFDKGVYFFFNTRDELIQMQVPYESYNYK